MDKTHDEIVRRWIPHILAARELGLPWEEVRAVVKLVLEAESTGDGYCRLPVPARPEHLHLMCCLLAEALEVADLPPVIDLVDTDHE